VKIISVLLAKIFLRRCIVFFSRGASFGTFVFDRFLKITGGEDFSFFRGAKKRSRLYFFSTLFEGQGKLTCEVGFIEISRGGF